MTERIRQTLFDDRTMVAKATINASINSIMQKKIDLIFARALLSNRLKVANKIEKEIRPKQEEKIGMPK
jgi:predicted nucleotidyltransferase